MQPVPTNAGPSGATPRGDAARGHSRGQLRDGQLRDGQLLDGQLHNGDLRVQPVTPALAPQVRALRAAADQYCYVGDAQRNLVDAEADPHSDAMAILLDGRVVGFYRIDLAPGAVGDCAFGGACAALRSMLIDRALQGGGLGTRALQACLADLRRRHPRLRLLALTVNCGNEIAVKAYRNAGFVDTGRLYFGGSAGPQRVMACRLDDASCDERETSA